MNTIKTIFAIIGSFVVFAGGYIACNPQGKNVTFERFEERHDILQAEVDSIKTVIAEISLNQDTLKSELRKVKEIQKYMAANQDTLKAGQRAIYKHVTNPKVDNNFFDEVLKFLE